MTAKVMMTGATLAMAIGSAATAQEVTLALSHWLPPVHEVHTDGMTEWAESIAAASDGRIQVDLYPAQQLGSAPDHYDLARDGIVDIAFVNPGYQAGRFPIIAAGELPFLVSNGTTANRALHEWYMQHAAQEMPDVHVCLVNLHDPGTFHATRGPIAEPGDYAGMNIRPPQGTIARMISLMGASPVQVPVPEMRAILSSGGADATVSPWHSLSVFNVADIVTHHLDLPLYSVTFVYAMNQGVYDSLSPENREVIDAHCTPEWSERINAAWAEQESSGRARLVDQEGHVFYTPDDAQMAQWQALSDQLREEWAQAAANAGLADPQAALEDLTARLQAVGAAYE
ncbi:TRAP transporter substrate-binding protein [Roseinatronobacter sp.]|uniref:TRAP transporter substrate-binding protein n=1 Tax=Roseinatronobacter sp. TaxID=1945755 RepID=UPI003F714947